MRSTFRHGAISLAFIGAGALMVAHRIGPALDLTAEAMSSTLVDDETTGSIDRSIPPGWIQLNDEQRGWIFFCVMNLPDVPEAAAPAPGPAGALPVSVELRDLPPMVTHRVPLVRDHKFVKLNDRILLVRASDRAVVSEIPRYRLLQ